MGEVALFKLLLVALSELPPTFVMGAEAVEGGLIGAVVPVL